MSAPLLQWLRGLWASLDAQARKALLFCLQSAQSWLPPSCVDLAHRLSQQATTVLSLALARAAAAWQSQPAVALRHLAGRLVWVSRDPPPPPGNRLTVGLLFDCIRWATSCAAVAL